MLPPPLSPTHYHGDIQLSCSYRCQDAAHFPTPLRTGVRDWGTESRSMGVLTVQSRAHWMWPVTSSGRGFQHLIAPRLGLATHVMTLNWLRTQRGFCPRNTHKCLGQSRLKHFQHPYSELLRGLLLCVPYFPPLHPAMPCSLRECGRGESEKELIITYLMIPRMATNVWTFAVLQAGRYYLHYPHFTDEGNWGWRHI